jgi:hypothetical protein
MFELLKEKGSTVEIIMQLRFCFWPDYEAHILTVLAGNFFEDELNFT